MNDKDAARVITDAVIFAFKAKLPELIDRAIGARIERLEGAVRDLETSDDAHDSRLTALREELDADGARFESRVMQLCKEEIMVALEAAPSPIPGPPGPRGEPGAPGRDGRDGTDGIDAAF